MESFINITKQSERFPYSRLILCRQQKKRKTNISKRIFCNDNFWVVFLIFRGENILKFDKNRLKHSIVFKPWTLKGKLVVKVLLLLSLKDLICVKILSSFVYFAFIITKILLCFCKFM